MQLFGLIVMNVLLLVNKCAAPRRSSRPAFSFAFQSLRLIPVFTRRSPLRSFVY